MGVHDQCFPVADPEEGRVELVGIVEEPAPPGVGLARNADLVGEQGVQVPPAVVGELADRRIAVAHEFP